MSKPIKHLVVLMMENRSFDHMLGFLKSPKYPIDGLNGNETNPDSTGALVRVSKDAHYTGDLSEDPGHDFISVNEQIFGNSQGTGNGPFMQGFVKAYQGKTGNVAKSHNVMRCFNPGRLPALSTLAGHYAVCDRWFASVPGPTLPNRAFAFGGTSQGRVDMTPMYLTLKTIFQLLDEHSVSSKLYYTDWTIGLAVGYILKNSSKFLFFFDDFLKDCKKNKLPAFSFIEPRFNDLTLPGRFFGASDQHPDHNVFSGEKVIKDVYDAISSNNQNWEDTLLVITYDEHGGLYDHVTPPAAVPPGDRPPGSGLFNFDRLGVRVPTVLVSPYIPKGTIVNNKVFDHTSIISTAVKLFVNDFANVFLTERDRHAATFEDCLTLTQPRTDKAVIPQPGDTLSSKSGPALESVAMSDGATAGFHLEANAAESPGSSNQPLNDFQSAMVSHAFALEGSLPVKDRTKTMVGAIRTEQHAAEYLEAMRVRIERIRQRQGNGRSKTAGKTAPKKIGGRKQSKKS